MSKLQNETSTRDVLGSRLVAFLVTLSSLVGLGNIVKFPATVGQNGGAAFILIYIIAVCLIGLPIMVAEFILGRSSRRNLVQSIEFLTGTKKYNFIGYLSLVACLFVLVYYSSVAGWVYSYLFKSIRGDFLNIVGDKAQILSSQFDNLVNSKVTSVLSQVFALAFICIISAFGVKKGIERLAKVAMPILLLILIGCSIYALTLSGAKEGLAFMLKPDFSKITPSVILSALGLAFFKLSLGIGCMVTYSSYFGKSQNLFATAAQGVLADLSISLLIGAVIFPSVFTFGLKPEAGYGLLFNVIPLLFSQMPGGNLLIILFFLLASIAATTALMAMMEVVLSFFVENFKFNRKVVSVSIWAILAIIGSLTVHPSVALGKLTFPSLGNLDLFNLFDYISSRVMQPIAGLCVILLVGYVFDKQIIRDQLISSPDNKNQIKLYNAYIFLSKYITPILIVIVFISSILGN